MHLLKILKDTRGQSVVEAALILPIILILLMGIFEFGRIFNTYLVITNASREGARCAAVGGSDVDIVTAISTATSTLEPSAMHIIITPSSSSRTRGVQTVVEIRYDIELIFPLISSISDPLTLKAHTAMRTE